MKPNVLFVLNQKAGSKSDVEAETSIREHAHKNGYPFKIYLCQESATSDLKKLIANFKPNIVCAMGGDGTINLVSSLIHSQDISLLIVPFGSANGMAKELQIPPTLTECLHLIERGESVAIDLVKVNGRISVHLSDVGLNAKIVRRFELDPNRGLITYAKHLFTEIFLLKRNRFEINFDNKVLKTSAVSLTFANATKYGTSAVINPDGILNDGWFEICIVKPFPKIHVINIAIQMFRNTLKYSEYFKIIKCKRASIICKRQTHLQNDGEPMGKVKQIELEIMPQALKVLIDPDLTHPTIKK